MTWKLFQAHLWGPTVAVSPGVRQRGNVPLWRSRNCPTHHQLLRSQDIATGIQALAMWPAPLERSARSAGHGPAHQRRGGQQRPLDSYPIAPSNPIAPAGGSFALSNYALYPVDGTLTVTPTAGLSGLVYEDMNANGQQDVGDHPLQDWHVYADLNGNDQYDPGEPDATTAANGTSTLPPLNAGEQGLAQRSDQAIKAVLVLKELGQLVR